MQRDANSRQGAAELEAPGTSSSSDINAEDERQPQQRMVIKAEVGYLCRFVLGSMAWFSTCNDAQLVTASSLAPGLVSEEGVCCLFCHHGQKVS